MGRFPSSWRTCFLRRGISSLSYFILFPSGLVRAWGRSPIREVYLFIFITSLNRSVFFFGVRECLYVLSLREENGLVE